jgi:hypothetical protein
MDDMRPIAAILSAARTDDTHIRLFTNAELAEGFNCAEGNIRAWKSRNKADLAQGIHWIEEDGKTLWTARGVIQLGFRLESPRAVEFRLAVEDLVMAVTNGSEPIHSNVTLSNTPISPLPTIAEAIARQSVADKLAGLTERAQHRILTAPTADDLSFLAARLSASGFAVSAGQLQSAIGASCLPGGDHE